MPPAVLDKLETLVVKAVGESGGYGMLIGPTSSAKEIEAFRAKLKAKNDDPLRARRLTPAGTLDPFVPFETFGDPADSTLVLINGLGSQCINFRTEWCDRFAGKVFQVVRLDNRDVGLSTHFSDVTPDLAALIARAASGVEADPERRSPLKRAGFLTRDARAVERKKAGLKGARRRPQFSKR